MQPSDQAVGYRIWAVDNVVYGPVELPELVDWVKDERVEAKTWVFSERDDCWKRASQVPELRMFFKAGAAPAAPAASTTSAAPGVSDETAVFSKQPESLRRIRIFGNFSDENLRRFVEFMEVLRVKSFTEVVKQGQTGDAMFFVLEGELRVRLMVSGKESTLVTLGPGEFFGEISLFDQGPRSADVIANTDSLLMKISSDAFQSLLNEAPDLAAPFLFAMSRTLTARIRADNKRYKDSINFARASR